MTRTLVRRLATAGGALGIALAVTAGPAAASVAPAASAPTQSTAAVTAGDDEHKCPCSDHDHDHFWRHGLLTDVVVDLVHVVVDLL